jgi:cyclopropane fatty-acyl-phospholipid synthase-like methyltransferase
MIEHIRGMAFPLNVYAHMLYLEWGKVDYLHYGLFEPGQADLGTAQARSSRLVFDRLPSAPARILDVGIGLGTTLAALVELGHDATGITPDIRQARVAQERFGIGSKIVCSTWEEFPEAGQPHDLILFQESAQYIDPKNIFAKAARLLVDGGMLQIQDEVGLRRNAADEPGLNLLADYLAQAPAHGLVLEEQIDLSAQAAPTLRHMLALVDKHRPALRQDLGVTEQQLDALKESNRLYEQKYADGRYGYALLRFRKVPGQG